MGWDCDDVFAYKTTRMVRIRDRRLGLMYYTALFFIFAYIVGFNVVWKQAYKAPGSVVGTCRLSLKETGEDYRDAKAEDAFCGSGSYSYISPSGTNYTYPQHNCRYQDEYDAQFPSLESDAIFMTTRVTQTEQRLPDDCLVGGTTEACQYHNVSSEVYFVANAAYFTLLVDHTMNVPKFNMSRTSHEMEGRLYDTEGNVVNPCDDYDKIGKPCPPYIHERFTSVNDIMPIATLLRAAGISSLDELSGPANPDESQRYAGVVLVLSIAYSNYVSYNASRVVYSYTVTAVPNTEFKTEQVIPAPGSDLPNRTIVDRHGVRIFVVQSGTVGAFDFQTLLVQLVSSVGLLAVANTTVDLIVTNVMPLKTIYRQYKTMNTVDFSDLTEVQKKAFMEHDCVNPPPHFPSDMEPDGDVDGPGGGGSSSISTLRKRDVEPQVATTDYHALGDR